MAKKDLIVDATKRGLKLRGDETVADLKALLAAAGEASDAVDAEAGDALDAIDEDIAALKAQLAERLTARAAVSDGAVLSQAQAESRALVAVQETTAQLEQERADAERAATLESFERSHETTTRTPQGVVQTMGLI